MLTVRTAALFSLLLTTAGCRGEAAAPPDPTGGDSERVGELTPSDGCPSVPVDVDLADPAPCTNLESCADDCDAGDQARCLAFMLALPSSGTAAKLLRTECARGHLAACFHLAGQLLRGSPHAASEGSKEVFRDGIDPDPECALLLLDIACSRGHLKSCAELERARSTASGGARR